MSSLKGFSVLKLFCWGSYFDFVSGNKVEDLAIIENVLYCWKKPQ